MDNQTIIEQPQADIKKELTSIVDLLKGAWKIYTVGIWKFIKLQLFTFVGAIPFFLILLVYAGSRFVINGGMGLNVVNVVLGIFGLVSLFFLAYIYLSVQVGQYLLIKNFNPDRKVIDLIKEAMPLVGGFFSLSILTGILVFLWFLLLIVPGIIFAIYYSFASWVFIFEERKGMEAIRRSKELVMGNWWNIAARYAAIGAIFYLVIIIFSIPFSVLAEGSVAYQAWNVVTTAVQFVITPFSFIYTYLVYNDLVKVKA